MSGNFVIAVAEVLNIVLEAYTWIIIIAAILSWVHPDPYNPLVRFLYQVTNPVLRPVRRIIGDRLGPIDISPVIVIICIMFLQRFLVRSLMEFGYRLKGGI
ncbi:MAG TPA: YggT family protein [Dissulfurispiraceae bacterium]|nr:YggT family protein [Dissulfurispiraceae bacterium]